MGLKDVGRNLRLIPSRPRISQVNEARPSFPPTFCHGPASRPEPLKPNLEG
jgi:hypothetical protein